MSLDRLLGTWDLSMQHSQMSEPIHGRQHYEYALENAFVVLHWTYEHPDFPDAIAILDQERYHYFDVRGVIRLFDFRLDDSGWLMTWLDPEFSQRSTGKFRDDDTIEVRGERSDDGGKSWLDDFTMQLTRVDGAVSTPG
jgi:hypothetical protein